MKYLSLALMVVALAVSRPAAAVSITVVPSVAPNAFNSFGSTAFDDYVTNAFTALEGGLAQAGDPATPAFYAATPFLGARDNIVSHFPSWRGFADPGARFGPAFANETGNRLLFGLHAVDSDQPFALAGLSLNLDSSDPGNAFGAFWDAVFGDPFTFDSLAYDRALGIRGIDYGSDGIKGTADDVVLEAGEAATTPVNELLFAGSGLACDASFGLGFSDLSEQGNLDEAATLCANLNGGAAYTVTATYGLDRDGDGSADVFAQGVAVIAEPLSALTLGGGLVAFAAFRRRRAR